MWYMVGSSNLDGSGPKVWNWGIFGAGAGWCEVSELVGEGASAGPVPAAEGGACDMGEDIVDELSRGNVSASFPVGSLSFRVVHDEKSKWFAEEQTRHQK
jgi:hypothetical protein